MLHERGQQEAGASSAPARGPPAPDPFANAYGDAKIVVHFRHTGDAPILKQSKFKVPASAKFSVVLQLLRSHLRLPPEASLFLYCNCAFAPSPDVIVGDVAACFASKEARAGGDGVLVLNYSLTPAWG